MDTYDSTLLPYFTGRLTECEAELLRVLQRADLAMELRRYEGDHGITDFKAMASDDATETVNEAEAESAAHALEEVLAARARLADGSYGQCLACGEPIDLRRLRALPAAALCTSCQEVRERVDLHRQWH